MKKDIRAVFVDMDGTLLYVKLTVSETVQNAFHSLKEKGILPIIATGRPLCETEFATELIGAEQYCIVMNGLEIYKDVKKRELLFETFIPEDVSKALVDWAIGTGEFFEVYVGPDSFGLKTHKPILKECSQDEEERIFFETAVTYVDDIYETIRKSDKHVNKVLLFIRNTEQMDEYRKQLEAFPGIVTLASGPQYIEIIPEGVDKALAVKLVREDLGLSSDQIMAIGDSENDMGMFVEAGTCVAMGNAFEMVKEKADIIAPTNKEHGVAWALENLI